MPPPGSAWSVAQPYSAGNTLTWDTTGLAPGPYRIGVWARSSGSSSPYRIGVWARSSGSSSSYESYAIITFWVGT